MMEINVGAGQKAVSERASDEDLVVKNSTSQLQAFALVGDIQE